MRQVSKQKRKGRVNLEYVDIRAVLDELNIPYAETGKNVSKGWVGVQCPMPGCGDHSNHCGISLRTPVISCYNCGRSGNYLTYLSAEMNSWSDAIDMLLKHTPRELRKYTEQEEVNNVLKVELPPEASKIPGQQHIDYLKGRGYNYKELESMYDLYFCGPSGNWANRIIAPIYKNYRMITFTSIDIAEESKLRYKHLAKELSIIHCKDYLYGLEQAIGRVICIVEGYFDKLRIGPGCVATFGTKVTAMQKKYMAGYDKVIIMFDGDDPGRINGKKLAQDISAFTDTELITLEDGMDPDKLPKEDLKEIKQILRQRW